MNKDLNFSRTVVIFSSRESLWKVLLSEQLYEKVWGAKLKTTWEPGADILFTGTWEGVEYFDKGVVQINDKYNTLKFSYWSSFWDVRDSPEEYCFITFKIHELDSMTCECTITQQGFRDEKHQADTTELLIKTLDTTKLEAEKASLESFSNNIFGKLIVLIESADSKFYNSLIDGWSLGQVVEHVVMSSSGLVQFFSEANSSSSVQYDSNVPAIRAMMLNTRQKLKTSEELVPRFEMFDREQHIKRLRLIEREIEHCIETYDFTRKCEAFSMPPFGHMSVFEWITFTIYHIARHTSQIEMAVKENSINRI